jgi:hypothetical protein
MRLMERARAYEAIAQTFADIGFDHLGWTPAVVAESERRIAIDDADVWDSSVHFAEFALRVLDQLAAVEPYTGPGEHHWSRTSP